jgi:hypothetical protein
MKVLIACEYSGTVRDAFIAKGHDAISCDLLPTDRTGPHYQGDVFDIINDGFDLMIAHPPCTHLAVSGAAWFKYKEREQKEALDFVQKLLDAPINQIALENPVSVISTRIRKPDQIIQPWQFGEPFSKKTCLWLKNLDPLKHTNIVDKGAVTTYASGKTMPTWYADAWKLPPAERAKLRSKTFQGIADAMAQQWG